MARKPRSDAPSLPLIFEPTSAFFRVRLPNGASFDLELRDVHGKLRDNLILFREATLEVETTPAPAPIRDYEAELLARGGMVQVVGVRKPSKIEISLEDLELDL